MSRYSGSPSIRIHRVHTSTAFSNVGVSRNFLASRRKQNLDDLSADERSCRQPVGCGIVDALLSLDFDLPLRFLLVSYQTAAAFCGV